MSRDRPRAGDATVIRPTVVEVSLARLTGESPGDRNRRRAGRRVMPIVKANAYGHGLVEVARHLVAQGARRLGVAFSRRRWRCGRPASRCRSW